MKREMLSEYPSEAILQALEDLEWCENNPNYTIDTGVYMEVDEDHCYVCQAGAILARRFYDMRNLGDRHMTPLDLAYVYPKSMPSLDNDGRSLLSHQVASFDLLVQGEIGEFLERWIDDIKEVSRVAQVICEKIPDWTSYGESKSQYKKNLRRVSKILDEEGY